MQVKVLFARFPYNRSEDPDVTDWMIDTIVKAKADPRISDVQRFRIDDTPITLGRNKTIEMAKASGADILVMVDSDMSPDAYLSTSLYRKGSDPLAKPFFDTSLDFMLNHEGPCIIASPYCGPPPHENMYVFQWGRRQNDHLNCDLSLDQFTREEAARWTGIVEVGALPTGLIMIDMRAFKRMKKPYFYYEYKDASESEKASTEDVTFTRDAALVGVKVYCNWDAWSGHWKRKCVGKPKLLTVDQVREQYREAIAMNYHSEDRLMMIERKFETNGEKKPVVHMNYVEKSLAWQNSEEVALVKSALQNFDRQRGEEIKASSQCPESVS